MSSGKARAVVHCACKESGPHIIYICLVAFRQFRANSRAARRDISNLLHFVLYRRVIFLFMRYGSAFMKRRFAGLMYMEPSVRGYLLPPLIKFEEPPNDVSGNTLRQMESRKLEKRRQGWPARVRSSPIRHAYRTCIKKCFTYGLKRHCARGCPFKVVTSTSVAQMTVRSVCECHGITRFDSFAIDPDESVPQKTGRQRERKKLKKKRSFSADNVGQRKLIKCVGIFCLVSTSGVITCHLRCCFIH